MKDKKLLLVFLVLVFAVLPITAYAVTTYDFGNGVTGDLSGGTLTVANKVYGAGVMNDFSFDTSPIYNDEGIADVVIEDGITYIGRNAFLKAEDSKITGSVIIGDSVQEIGDTAFTFNKLTSVKIGNSVKTIGERVFTGNLLESITIPDSVQTIGFRAFADNPITSLTLGSSIQEIGEQAFYNNQLTAVTIPDSIHTLGEFAFSHNRLTSITIPENIGTIGEGVFAYNQLTAVTIPNCVKTITGRLFLDNQLTSVTIPDSVETIEGKAFADNLLTEIVIGSGVDIADDEYEMLPYPPFEKMYGTTGKNLGFKAVYDAGGRQAGTYIWNASASRWEKQVSLAPTYTVTYNSNNSTEGTVPVDSGSYAAGEIVTVLGNQGNLSKTGYAFAGWNTAADGTGTTYHENDTFTMGMAGITLYAEWEKTSSGGSSKNKSSREAEADTPVIVIVNGEEENAGQETYKEENGKQVVKVFIKPELIEAKITAALKNNPEDAENFVEIPVADTAAEIARVALTGDIVKKMEANEFTLSVKRSNIQYNIPAKELTIEVIAEKLNLETTQLRAIEIEVQMTKAADEANKQYKKAVKARKHEIIVPPVEFDIIAKTVRTNGETDTVAVSNFSNYVDRVIGIPVGVDPDKITTGIVFDSDGSYSHVPTEVFKENSRYYARINSLTNSTYSIIWNPVTVDAVQGHWSEKAVNDMASRLVILDTEGFMPDKAINRAEFANYIVRALGLYREGLQPAQTQQDFSDVDKDHLLLTGITIAGEWGIVDGYSDGTFKPDNTITREEAMTMYAKAVDIVKLTAIDKTRILNYDDESEVAPWAYEAVRKTLGTKVFNGRSGEMIEPKGTFTHAEAATAIRNLLIEAGLINK